MILRRAVAGDRAVIYAVHAAAFARAEQGVPGEASLVDRLREDGDLVPGLSIVAELDGEVVGHVACSRGKVDGRVALGFGPLGVVPRHHRRGIGQALVHAVLAAADALDEPAVLLLGDPGYYRRFGFEPAGSYGVHPPVAEWAEHFQLRRLTAWTNAIRGTFHYPPAFDRL